MTPAAHAEHAHRLLCLVVHCIGANGTAAKEGASKCPLLTATWGGIPYKMYKIYPLPHLDLICPPLDRKPYSLLTNYDTFKSEYSEDGCTSPPTGTSKPRAEHPIVSSSCDRLSTKKDGIASKLNKKKFQARKQMSDIFDSWEMEWEKQKTHNLLLPGTCYSGYCAWFVVVGPGGIHAHIEAFTTKTTPNVVASLCP